MVEFFQQYGSYISAIVVIIFQIIKTIINNKKMDDKFGDFSSSKKLKDKYVKLEKKSDNVSDICDAIKSAEKFKQELSEKIDALKSELDKKSVLVKEAEKVGFYD